MEVLEGQSTINGVFFYGGFKIAGLLPWGNEQ